MKRPEFDPLSLGNLARILFNVAREHIDRAVMSQRVDLGDNAPKLGEILVRHGALKKPELERLLTKQERLRRGDATATDIQKIADFAASATEEHGDKMAEAIRVVREKLR